MRSHILYQNLQQSDPSSELVWTPPHEAPNSDLQYTTSAAWRMLYRWIAASIVYLLICAPGTLALALSTDAPHESMLMAQASGKERLASVFQHRIEMLNFAMAMILIICVITPISILNRMSRLRSLASFLEVLGTTTILIAAPYQFSALTFSQEDIVSICSTQGFVSQSFDKSEGLYFPFTFMFISWKSSVGGHFSSADTVADETAAWCRSQAHTSLWWGAGAYILTLVTLFSTLYALALFRGSLSERELEVERMHVRKGSDVNSDEYIHLPEDGHDKEQV